MEGQVNAQQGEGSQAPGCSPMVILLGIGSAIVSFAWGLEWEVKEVEIGTIVRIFIVIMAVGVGTPVGVVGGLIGDVLRRIACPDAIFTTGGMSAILKQKLFWAIGPQCIGMLIGSIVGGGTGALIVCKIAGIPT